MLAGEGGHGWTPIEPGQNKQFRLCFNDLVLNRSGVQVGRRSTTELLEGGGTANEAKFCLRRSLPVTVPARDGGALVRGPIGATGTAERWPTPEFSGQLVFRGR